MVNTTTSEQEGSWFESQLGPFCLEFVCSPRVCVGFSHPPKHIHVKLICGSKLTVGVSVDDKLDINWLELDCITEVH